MSQMTPAQARAVDPILTEIARGYRSPKAAAADALFPIVQVSQRAGKIISFGLEDFRLISSAYAPGAAAKRVQVGYASGDFALTDFRLEAVTPYILAEEAAAVPGIDLIAASVRKVQNAMALERERAAAVLATTAGNYGTNNKDTLSGTAQWSDPSSSPAAAIAAAREAIRSQTGEYPNTLVVSPKVRSALSVHPKLLDRISTSSDRTPLNLAQLAALLEVDRVVVGEAIYHDGSAFVDVWGKDAVLAYTTPASLQEMGSPSYGYTYQLAGRPMVEEGYDDRSHNSWVNPVTDARKAVIAASTAGFLFKAAVA